MKRGILAVTMVLLAAGCNYAKGASPENRFLVLCYHDIPVAVEGDQYAVDRESLVQQIEYLRTHGYHFIGMDDIRRAEKNEKELPDKAVLLTFDDGYQSFYQFVFPLLKLYGYPCVLSVVTGWIDNPPKDVCAPVMTSQELKEVAQSGFVEIASHTHDIHATVTYNPQGNNSWAAVSRIYDQTTGTYETEPGYRARIRNDLARSRDWLREKLGIEAGTLVWPFGEYSRITVEEAKGCGFTAMFVLEDTPASAYRPEALSRYIVVNNPTLSEFIKLLKQNPDEPVHQRILQADLDLIYDADPLRQEKNLDAFIERVVQMKVNTVYLQAFCDDAADGNIASVYFPNRVLPMKTDLFNRVANQLAIREILVYAWMPMLSITLPDREENNRLRVLEFKDGGIRLSPSWYRRLSPFSPEAAKKLEMLYADMAANARIDGVIFQDDGYLTDYEDFHPAAREEYRRIAGDENISYQDLSEEKQTRWTQVKTRKLIELTGTLKDAVRRYRPQTRFARTLYAPVVTEPGSEEWFAQNYTASLAAYDYVVIMAYPFMEKVRVPERWLTQLIKAAKKHPAGMEKTVFKVQAYDWEKERWVKSATVHRWLKTLVSRGARHLAYYPDSYVENKPEEKIIRRMMSTEDFPFNRSGER